MPATSMNALASAPGSTEAATWDAVRKYMLRHCGVVLSDEQRYLLDPRLAPVAKDHRFATIAELVAAASNALPTAPLGMALIEAMTTHETMFFRDPPFWRMLEKQVLPQLFAENRGGLKIWCAACSTGQEVYSMAMLLEEAFPQHVDKTTIYADDVSTISVDKARAGIYSTMEVNRGLGAVRLQRHFEQAPRGFQVKPKLRTRIVWATSNLLGGASSCFGADLVLCRNVLIYFSDLDRAAVISRLFQTARAGGVVGVGSTESIRDMQPLAPGLYSKPAR